VFIIALTPARFPRRDVFSAPLFGIFTQWSNFRLSREYYDGGRLVRSLNLIGPWSRGDVGRRLAKPLRSHGERAPPLA
jgi:hypothetical protein